jgi:hypothetical protein
MGLNSSSISIVAKLHNGSHILRNAKYTISYVVVEQTLTSVSWDDFPYHFRTSTDLMMNLTQSLALAVYSDRATYLFRKKLLLLGCNDAILPGIVAVFAGSIPSPTALPSLIPVVSKDLNSPNINATLISGLVAGFFAFFCVCIPILYLTRRRYLEKWSQKSGSDMFFYDIFAPRDDVAGLNKIAVLKLLKTREELQLEAASLNTSGAQVAAAGDTINSPVTFNDFNSIFGTEKSHSMWSRKSSAGDDAFNDWVNSLNINKSESSESSKSNQSRNVESAVAVDLINRSPSDTIVYEDIYSSENYTDIAPTWNMASQKAATQSSLQQNIPKDICKDLPASSNKGLKTFHLFDLPVTLLGVKNKESEMQLSETGSDVDITEIYPEDEHQYSLSAAESVFIAQSYIYSTEKEIMKKTELQIQSKGVEDVNNMMIDIAEIYPDADKIFLPELSSNGVGSSASLLHSTPVEIRQMKAISPHRNGNISKYYSGTYQESDHCPLTDAVRKTLPVYDIDEVDPEKVGLQHSLVLSTPHMNGGDAKHTNFHSQSEQQLDISTAYVKLDSKGANFQRYLVESECFSDDEEVYEYDSDIGIASDKSRSTREILPKSGLRQQLPRGRATTTSNFYKSIDRFSQSDESFADKLLNEEYDELEQQEFNSNKGRRSSSVASSQVSNLSWKQTFSLDDADGGQGLHLDSSDDLTYFKERESHVTGHHRIFENMRLLKTSSSYSADTLKRIASAEDPLMRVPSAVPENFEQAPVHREKFQAIKMKFETMIQRNTKLSSSSSFTTSPPHQAAAVVTTPQQQQQQQSLIRCRSDDITL